MKPLSIEELKALEEGEWVWIVTPMNTGEYYQKFYESSEDFFVGGSLYYGFNASYEDYVTKWVAYKNKEQAEEKERCKICHMSLENILPKVDEYGNKYCNGCYKAKYTLENLKRS